MAGSRASGPLGHGFEGVVLQAQQVVLAQCVPGAALAEVGEHLLRFVAAFGLVQDPRPRVVQQRVLLRRQCGDLRRQQAGAQPFAQHRLLLLRQPARAVDVVVGDAAVVKPQLDGLGLPVEIATPAN